MGYVVKEAANDVHAALNAQKIAFDWIRFKFYHPPGWYAGIRITKSGEWSQQVLLSRSAS